MTTTLRLILLILLLALSAVSSLADDVAPVSLACDGAAPSQLAVGNTARPVQVLEPFSFSQNNGQALLDLLLADIIENVLLTNTHSVFADPALAPVMAYNIPFSSEVSILGEMQCVTIDDGNTVLRYWRVQTPQATGYMIESVTFGLREVTVDNPEGAGTVIYPFENFTLRLLRPVFRPVIPQGGGGTVQAPDAALPQYPCAPAPESRLSVGMQAEMISDGWMNYATYDANFQFAGYGDNQPLDAYGLTVMSEVMLRGLLLNPLIDPESEDAVVIPAETVLGTPGLSPIVDIVGGPVCVSQNVYPLPTNPYNQPDRFMTYWQIAVDVNDTQYVGWYPENSLEDVWFAAENPDIAIGGPALVTTYHLVPLGSAMAPCTPTQLFAGQSVQVVGATVNLRATPGGDVIDRLSLSQVLPIYGEPICAGGVNWWQTNGGFVAETEPISGMRLLRPADVVTPVPTIPSQEAAPSGPTPTINPIQAQPIRPTQEPGTPPRSADPTPTPEPRPR